MFMQDRPNIFSDTQSGIPSGFPTDLPGYTG